MYALTVCEPFASALIYGGKLIENRRRPIGMTGPLLIHAGKSLDWFAPEHTEWLHARWPDCPASPVAAMHKFKRNMGKVIGMLWAGRPLSRDVLSPQQFRWGTGPVCIPCSFPAPVTPFNLRGQQGIFIVPAASLTQEIHDKADDIRMMAAEAAERVS